MRAADRRQEILDVAAKVFAQSGIRASLDEIAMSCGIQTGSLYHHFDSKDALVTALVERFHDELQALGVTTLPDQGVSGSVSESITEFACAIAASGRRHRAALMLTYIEPPRTSGRSLRNLAQRVPTTIATAMTTLLERGQSAGEIRPELDASVLAALLCQNMLQTAVGTYFRTSHGGPLPEVKCQLILNGLLGPVTRAAQLDGPAHLEVDDLIVGWKDSRTELDERRAHIRAVARAEFARRGVALTTIRDIAAAGGISARAVYRSFDSKDELVTSILTPYLENFRAGWLRMSASTADPLDKIDALCWLVINLHDQFREEQRVAELATQQAPPHKLRGAHGPFPDQLELLNAIMVSAEEAGLLRRSDAALSLRAGAVFSAMFPPANLATSVSVHERLALARETIFRGIAVAVTDA